MTPSELNRAISLRGQTIISSTLTDDEKENLLKRRELDYAEPDVESGLCRLRYLQLLKFDVELADRLSLAETKPGRQRDQTAYSDRNSPSSLSQKENDVMATMNPTNSHEQAVNSVREKIKDWQNQDDKKFFSDHLTQMEASYNVAATRNTELWQELEAQKARGQALERERNELQTQHAARQTELSNINKDRTWYKTGFWTAIIIVGILLCVTLIATVGPGIGQRSPDQRQQQAEQQRKAVPSVKSILDE